MCLLSSDILQKHLKTMMEKEQAPSDSPEESPAAESSPESPAAESSPESPAAETIQESNEDSNGDYVDSLERVEKFKAGRGNETSKSFLSRNSPENPSAMEGELDFEDEVVDEKEESLKETLEDDRETAEQEKPSENDCAEEVVRVQLSNTSEEEDGEVGEDECPAKSEKEGSIEEGEDEGELSDEDDLEEGEVKDSSPTAKSQARQVCRFFNRGQCTWGNLCRFLHLSVNDRGNYNMFAPSTKMVQPFSGTVSAMMGPRGVPRIGPDYHQPPPPPPLPPLPPPVADTAPVESAWERGLRHAKELIKKSTRRKEQEPDFEEKRLNLSLSNEDNDRESTEFDKENDFYAKPPQRRQSDAFNSNRYDDNDDVFDNGEREAREHWRGGRYENFEIRWTRQEMHKDRRPEKDKARNARFSSEREKPKQWRGGGGGGGPPQNKWRDDRLSEIQAVRPRADEWRDPWRRSKTPKGRRSRSRGRSHGSYSSVSSRSYSERSSRSSYSYSHSSSRSSLYSSHSPSPGKSTLKRKDSPRKTTAPSTKIPNRPSPYKKKPPALRRTQSRSYSRSRSSRSRYSATRSRSSSSRSISRSRSASRSRSRSYSRSLSMDSVSSASSSISHSSGRSGTTKKRAPHVPAVKREEAKPPLPVPIPPKANVPKPPTTSLFDEMQRLRQYDKMRETQKALNAAPKKPMPPPIAPKEKKQEAVPPTGQPQTVTADSSTKDLQKQPPQKQQIKLTLLNKAVPSRIPNPLKKELDTPKPKLPEKDDKAAVKPAVKRPASPSGNKAAAAAIPAKRSTSSRRDELLKQLKAVEDAIARKRAKFS